MNRSLQITDRKPGANAIGRKNICFQEIFAKSDWRLIFFLLWRSRFKKSHWKANWTGISHCDSDDLELRETRFCPSDTEIAWSGKSNCFVLFSLRNFSERISAQLKFWSWRTLKESIFGQHQSFFIEEKNYSLNINKAT